MTDETQGASPAEDAPLSAPEPEAVADSSPAPEVEPQTDSEAPEQPRDEEGKFLSPKAQKRIDHLTWEREQQAREAQYWREQALAAQKPQTPEPPKEPTKLPSLEEYGYDEGKYQAALLEHARELARAEVRKELDADRQQQSEQKRLSSFAERQREFAKSTPDFEQKVLQDPTLPISATMRDVIVDSSNGPEIAYYLANNREAAQTIATLPPHLAALELGRIEGRLSALKEAKTRPVPVVSKAPPPPPRVEDVEVSLAGIKASDASSDKLSDAEWTRLREKELKRKKG